MFIECKKCRLGFTAIVGAGLRDCQLSADIVGETRPYNYGKNVDWDLPLSWGRVYEIVNYRPILLVKPARQFWQKCAF